MKKYLLLAFAATLSGYTFAQPSLAKLSQSIKKQRGENLYQLKLSGPNQGALQFSVSARLKKTDIKSWLASSLGFRNGKDDLQKTPFSVRNANNIEVEKYQQWYQGIKVEHGFANVVSNGGNVAAVQLEFYPLADSFSTTPKITEQEALQKALASIGAAKYVWEGYSGKNAQWQKPSGSLVIIEDYYGKKGQLVLAYKFDIYALQPLSRAYVYVNAVNGAIVLVDRIIKHLSPDIDGHASENGNKANTKSFIANKEKSFGNATGQAQTRYSGTQTIVTDDSSAVAGKPYRLRQVRNGHNIITLNYQRKVLSIDADTTAVDFTDDDNNWTTAEMALNYDDAALDVQFAMQAISDYWKTVHGRNSWDNQGGEMKSYVHVRASANAGFNNAFWDGTAMYYGDGTYYSNDGSGVMASSSGFKPLTSLDVSAHELGHAVCQSTAQLVYQRESGGINEGFSDIWAACVENYSGLPKSPFLIGEDITPAAAGGALRSMKAPKQFFNPDTYGGQYWIPVSLSSCNVPSSGNDECGVHYNSGVLNKWFYLITQGGTGTNDNKDSYNVSGLGFAKSEQIAFLTEQSLTPNADYAATRAASINAAATLFGATSNEVVQVTNAWFAVGVGESANLTPVVEFIKTGTTLPEGNGLTGNCSSTQTVSVPVKLASAATQKTDVQFSFGGTAVQGVNYTVASPVVSFNAGESGTKNLDIAILDNATAEGNKTIVLTYVVNANGGNAAAGVNNQTYTITITDDDVLPLPIKTTSVARVTLLREDFEAAAPGTVFPTGWNAGLYFSGGNSATNVWAIGGNAGAGFTGNAAYISNTATGAIDYAYSTVSTTDRLLRLPSLNTTGLTDLRLSFKYKVGGEVDPIDPASSDPYYEPRLWDYGRLVFDTTGAGTTYQNLFNTTANDYFAFVGDGTTAMNVNSFPLPSYMQNRTALYLGFRWLNDDYWGTGLPLAIDDIVITGKPVGSCVETAANAANTVKVLAGNTDSYIASSSGNLLAKLSNLNQSIPCLTASLAQAGSGRVTINTSNGSFFRTQKIVQLTPGVANATATYKATFYFTASDLSQWSAAEIPQLKILKVKDGVDLNGTLTASDAQLVTPVFTDNSANGYYSYSGDFTGFSQFMLVSPTFTLPVNLLTFEAQPHKKSIDLSWTTATETANKGFEVERSSNGNDFISIGWVNGSGSTTTATTYRFTDNFVQPNVTYQYRLKQVNTDHHFSYSSIKQARLADESITITVSPNPATNSLHVFVAGATQPSTISLLDGKGHEVAQWKNVNPGTVQQLNVSRFSRGVYTLAVHLPDGDKTTQVLLQ
jgi:Zn-dependent metalloprotease